MKNFLAELIVSLVLLALVLVLFNPSNIFMPTYVEMCILAALVVLFGVFANFIWREKAGDEREQLHRMFADRLGFLVGSGVLILGIVIQEFSHTLNSWLLLTFAVMVIAKVAGLIYAKIKS
jgi:hypothetical protein